MASGIVLCDASAAHLSFALSLPRSHSSNGSYVIATTNILLQFCHSALWYTIDTRSPRIIYRSSFGFRRPILATSSSHHLVSFANSSLHFFDPIFPVSIFAYTYAIIIKLSPYLPPWPSPTSCYDITAKSPMLGWMSTDAIFFGFDG